MESKVEEITLLYPEEFAFSSKGIAFNLIKIYLFCLTNHFKTV